MKMPVVVFDLDDTLFKEEDFVDSAYRFIDEAHQAGGEEYALLSAARRAGKNPFDELMSVHGEYTIGGLLDLYRYHTPHIALSEGAAELLSALRDAGCPMGVITDGRERTQTLKLRALGIAEYFKPEDVIISEAVGHAKTEPYAVEQIMAHYPAARYFYVGDNPAKDFIQPNLHGWTTVMLRDDGRNVHPQELACDADDYEYPCTNGDSTGNPRLPDYVIDTLPELLTLLGRE